MNDTAATQSWFSSLANPTRFLALAGAILPWLGALTALCFAVGIWLSFTTEGDYQQGETVRIMYIHVPSAWLAMMCYTIMAIAALGTLTFMPAFVYDGILIGLTQNVVMRNGMVASLVVFLIAALVLKMPLGNLGLWLSLHLWFLARGGFYWAALERRRGTMFA